MSYESERKARRRHRKRVEDASEVQSLREQLARWKAEAHYRSGVADALREELLRKERELRGSLELVQFLRDRIKLVEQADAMELADRVLKQKERISELEAMILPPRLKVFAVSRLHPDREWNHSAPEKANAALALLLKH